MKINKIIIMQLFMLSVGIYGEHNSKGQIDQYFIREGVSPLFNSYPLPENEIVTELRRVGDTEAGSINDILSKDWDYAEDVFKFNSDITITTEGYIHSNREYIGWDYDFFKRKPFINIELDFQVTDYIFATVDFPLMKDRLIADRSTENFTNVIYKTSDLDMNIPNKAYINFGIPHLNLTVGRGLINMGQGLLLSPNTFYHDFLRLSTNWKPFRYDYTLLNLNEVSYDEVTKNTDSTPKYLIAHSLGFSILDKVSLTVTESVMIQDLDFDLKVLNPFLILHNEYLSVSDHANAFMTINISATPIKRLQVFGELAVDQYATPYENGVWEQEEPNAIGWILGIRTLIPVSRYELDITAKYTHTDPYLGLDSSGINFTTTKRYVTHSQPDDNANGIPVTDFLGVGPDKQILSFSCDIVGFSKFTAGMEYQFKRLGDINSSSLVKTYDKETLDRRTPSGNFATLNVVTLKAGYDITENLYGYSQISYINQDNTNDVQFILSLSYLF